MPPIPFPPALNGVKEGTFVFITIKDRWPKILTRVIDQVHRYRLTHIELYPKDGDNDIKSVIGELSELKYRMSTDKPLENVNDDGESSQIWNESLEMLRKSKSPENVTWFKTDWLFVECYLYRRIAGSFFKTRKMTELDPFASLKQNSFVDSLPAMNTIGRYILENDWQRLPISDAKVKTALLNLFQVCLWGNKCDLSLSVGNLTSPVLSPLQQIQQLESNILVNDLELAESLLRKGTAGRVDIVLDNAGIELFSDLALAEFLLSACYVQKVVIHGKTLPWFVSDATGRDFAWLIEMLRENRHGSLSELGHKWHQRLADSQIEFRCNSFWTLPFPYYMMKEKDPSLYSELSHSTLIIFKGDLNYRKLVGDLEWPLDTPFKIAVRGFHPSPFIALRTLKAETQAGLSEESIKRMKSEYGESKKWMVTGDYGVAQLCA
ncbi:hypothetical protein AB6A40_001922 [Gnathostoma spinigerum]|uniref:Sugar phosphate phosphatase n=1 Tax=Gnathostoma spinigerum TaxID=75299 RepID=A0ABD6E5G4_9BILA